MTPANLLKIVVDPGLVFMASVIGPKPPISDEARLMLLAIAGQEGSFRYRRQVEPRGRFGPADSVWQEEMNGGVAGVLAHTQTGPWLRVVCDALDIASDKQTVWQAIAWNDHLAVAVARLNLWRSPGALPGIGQMDLAWLYYEHLWTPGSPGPDRWPSNYHAAMAAIQQGTAA